MSQFNQVVLRGPGQQDEQSVLQAQNDDTASQSNDPITSPMLGSEEHANYIQVRDDPVRNKLQEIFSIVDAQTTRLFPQNVRNFITSRGTVIDTQTNRLQGSGEASSSYVDLAVEFERRLGTLTPLLRTQSGSHSARTWAISEPKSYAISDGEKAARFLVASTRPGPAARSDSWEQEVIQSCVGLLSKAFSALKNDEMDAAIIHLGEIGVKMNGYWDKSLMHPEQASDALSITRATDRLPADGLQNHQRTVGGPELSSDAGATSHPR